jgi:2-iminoacetate synthase ThiH
MAGIFDRALEQAGLTRLAERALSDAELTRQELAALRGADVLLLAGLADAVRTRFHGDEVRVLSSEQARRDADLSRLAIDAEVAGATGQELLVEVAMARLATPARKSVAVSVEQLGLQLAQVALTFGADVLICDLSNPRTLPLLDGPAARRTEVAGLIARAGRRVRWVDAEPRPALPELSALESRS